MNIERAARIDQYGAPEVLAVEPVEVTGPSCTYGLDDIVTAHHGLEGRRITGAGIIIP